MKSDPICEKVHFGTQDLTDFFLNEARWHLIAELLTNMSLLSPLYHKDIDGGHWRQQKPQLSFMFLLKIVIGGSKPLEGGL